MTVRQPSPGYVSAGSNLGDREAHLRFAVEALAAAGLRPLALSSVWDTEAVDCAESLRFLNMVVAFESALAPLDVLAILQDIERRAGRVRRRPNAPRTLDLDLLLYGDRELRGRRLELPHPRMWQRSFVLAPLAEIAPGLRNPLTGRTLAADAAVVEDGRALRRVGPLAPARVLPL